MRQTRLSENADKYQTHSDRGDTRMTRKYWLDLTPSLLVGIGIILATLVAVLTAKSGWLILAGPLVLAVAVIGADVLARRLRGASSSPSPAAVILGAAFLLAGAIVTFRDPSQVASLIPIVGVTAWVALLMRPGTTARPA
jgi:uncharacterized membrane protein SirB2